MPMGKCPQCGSWGTLSAESAAPVRQTGGGTAKLLTAENIRDVPQPQRLSSGFTELDRVLGGGWIPGGVVLLGGEPGIGKSTLLLQACGKLAEQGHHVLYISGEESASQLSLRGQRLKVLSNGLDLCCHPIVDEALALINSHDLVVVDSVQAMKTGGEPGWPGSPTQVRAVAQACLDKAKAFGVPMVLVGHITKEGRIAGPMLLEHMVDTVIMFSGDNSSVYRTLRASKNRYGGTDEIGVFEMGRDGLSEVPDPSQLYWNSADSTVPGVAMTVLMEGSRPLMAEIQSLSSETVFSCPKRTGIGVGFNKICLLLAVLQSRCGIASAKQDVYCNVAGGLEVRDPAADLAIAAALASSIVGISIGPECILIGEVGLAGEVRPVSGLTSRLREAARLGFHRAIVSSREKTDVTVPLTVHRVPTVRDAMRLVSML